MDETTTPELPGCAPLLVDVLCLYGHPGPHTIIDVTDTELWAQCGDDDCATIFTIVLLAAD